MDKVDSLYHYCSADTFMSIIQNRTIRLADLNKTNDYQEKKWAAKLISEVLKERLISNGIKIDLEDNYWYDEISPNHLQYFINEMNSVLLDEKPILIACFSQEKDLLSQWRAYGEDGSGICIGFNRKNVELLGICKNIIVENVYYEKNEQKSKIGELIDNAIYYMEVMFSKDKTKVSDSFIIYFEENFDVFCEVLIPYIEKVACTIKNPAFSEEDEIRIIYTPGLQVRKISGDITLTEANDFFVNKIDVGDFKIGPIKFRNKNNQLVAYSDVDFSKLTNQFMITEIRIGPKCRFTENDIYYYLLSNGFDANLITITESDATYS